MTLVVFKRSERTALAPTTTGECSTAEGHSDSDGRPASGSGASSASVATNRADETGSAGGFTAEVPVGVNVATVKLELRHRSVGFMLWDPAC